MADTVKQYRDAEGPRPETYLSWDLFGAGLENLGRDGKPVELPLREPKADEILLRVDALGLCFSDTKLIWAGPDHPRIQGRDLQNDPTVAGHEAALTVVRVGDSWKDKFKPGQRFIIQADIYINGEQKAYGYVQRGAMAQYTYVGPDVLAGDDGCYLLPLRETTGYAEAALVEPWACVEAAYHIPVRTAPKPGGRMLIVSQSGGTADLTGLCADGALPASVTVIGEFKGDLSPVLDGREPIREDGCPNGCMEGLVKDRTGGEGFDDILIVGTMAIRCMEACDRGLAKGGHLALLGTTAADAASFDLGRIHYELTRPVGASTGRALDAYRLNARQEIKGGGLCWMIGAAGPMGQMHVQRALELEAPPKRIVATDISQERLDYMATRLRPLAEERGTELVCLDVTQTPDLDGKLNEFTGGAGFDDIVVLAPVAKLVEHAAGFAGDKCVLNVFAGVPLGTQANLPIEMFTQKNGRVIGSSGSSMEDITNVLRKMEANQLRTRMSLAALGGIETVWEGIKGVKEGRFPGKTVIFPHLRDLPLVEPEALGDLCPEAAGVLGPGGVWTNEAEKSLFAQRL